MNKSDPLREVYEKAIAPHKKQLLNAFEEILAMGEKLHPGQAGASLRASKEGQLVDCINNARQIIDSASRLGGQGASDRLSAYVERLKTLEQGSSLSFMPSEVLIEVQKILNETYPPPPHPSAP